MNTVEAAQRLLDLFARLDGDAVRMLVAKGTPDAEFDQALRSVYVGQELLRAQNRFAREAQLQFKGYAKRPKDSVFVANSVIDARRDDCVLIRGTADLQPRYMNPVQPIDGVFLIVVQTGVSPTETNPTSWRLLAIGDISNDVDRQAICPSL